MFYSIVNSLYYPGIYLLNQSLPLDTTALDTIPLLWGKLSKAGFDKKMPCITVIRAIGDIPEIDITKKDGLISSFTLAFDIKCKKHASDPDYSQVFTINTQKIDFVGRVSCTLSFLFFLDRNPTWINSENKCKQHEFQTQRHK